jgi:outer membrane protein TolC
VKPLDPESLREVRASRLKIAAFDEQIQAFQSDRWPDVSLQGKVTSSGVRETPEDSSADLVSGKYPDYYVGIRIQSSFGSDLQNEEIRNRVLSKSVEQVTLDRRLNEIRDEQSNDERSVKALFSVVKSSELQKSLRDRAVQELTRGYNQGRVDINILIEAMNRYFASLVQYSKALGDYQMALNEWAATRDELIPDEAKKE